MPTTFLPKVGVDSNYNDKTAAGGSQSELTRLRLENQALQLLLKEHINKFISVQEEEDGDEVSSTRRALPAKKNTIPLLQWFKTKQRLKMKVGWLRRQRSFTYQHQRFRLFPKDKAFLNDSLRKILILRCGLRMI